MDIIVLNRKATEKNIDNLLKKLEGKGLKATISRGTEKTVIGVIGDTSRITEEEENAVRVMKGVEDVVRILKPYKLASRGFQVAEHNHKSQRESHRRQKNTCYCGAMRC